MYTHTCDNIVDAIKKKCNFPQKPLETYAMVSIEPTIKDNYRFLAINIVSGWYRDNNKYGFGIYFPWIHNTSMINDRTNLHAEVCFTTMSYSKAELNSRLLMLIKLANEAGSDMIIKLNSAYKSRGAMNPRVIAYTKTIHIPADSSDIDDVIITDDIIEDKTNVMKILNSIKAMTSYVENKMNNNTRRFDLHIQY